MLLIVGTKNGFQERANCVWVKVHNDSINKFTQLKFYKLLLEILKYF